MDDLGSRRGSRVKKEVAPPDGGTGNSIAGESELHKQYAAAASAALAKGSKRSNVAGFLAKAYQIFDNPVWSDICGWGHGGETVVIRKQIDFAKKILPLFFNHSNLQSFVRQLNMYNFRKVVQDPNSGEFKHDLFRKGNEHALHKIKRKQSAAAAAAAAGSNSRGFTETGKYRVEGAGAASGTAQIAGGIVQEAEKVLDELVELRKWKEEMENTVVVLKEEKQTLQGENQMLKGQVAQHGDQQLVLQNKMQKILFCMYDAYVSGLRGEAAAANPALTGPEGADGGDPKTALATAGGGGGESAAGGGGAVASTALEKALQQLAALAGENMSSRINALEMENPWSGGGGSGDVSVPGAAPGAGAGDGVDGAAPPVLNGTSSGGNSNSSSSGNGVIVGGGALKRSRTGSQSYEWLKSLRDPDPIVSIGSPSSFASPTGASPKKQESRSPNPHTGTAYRSDGGFAVDDDKANVRGVSNSTNGVGVRDAHSRSSSSGSVSFSGNGSAGVDVVTPERALPVVKRQRVTWPGRDGGSDPTRGEETAAAVAAAAASSTAPAFLSGGESSSGATAPPATATVTTDREPCGDDGGNNENRSTAASTSGRSDNNNDNNNDDNDNGMSDGGGISSSSSSNNSSTGGSDFCKMASFQPNAPLPKGSSFSRIVNEVEKAETTRRGTAAAGGGGGSGDVWGGGALAKTMSEGATQVVSELGEMGHREGEALSKIDSLGFQLANLLDPSLSFEDMILGEASLVGELPISGDHVHGDVTLSEDDVSGDAPVSEDEVTDHPAGDAHEGVEAENAVGVRAGNLARVSLE